MKTPTDFGIDPYGARNGNGIYGTKWICYYDAEDYIERCRTRFAEDVYNAKPLPQWDSATQQFLVVAREQYEKFGDKGLVDYFNHFAEYVIFHLPLYSKIDEWREYNSRVIAYNDYVCENSNGKLRHHVKHPDYISELLDWFPNNWTTYWDYCGSDSQRVGGNFRYFYNNRGTRDEWGERNRRFYEEITKVFIDRINEELSKRKKVTVATMSGGNLSMSTRLP